jgi:uncharacterized protein (DUF983 family)
VAPGSDEPHHSPFSTGLTGRCPRCGKGKIFEGFLKVAPRCPVCGLDLGFADSGDGPAVFVTLFAGLIVVGIALWTELVFEPPFWVHAVVFLPLTLLVCVSLLRPLKGMMVALQYRHRAGQGRLDS